MIYSYFTRTRLLRIGIFIVVLLSVLSVRLILLARDIPPAPIVEPPVKLSVRYLPVESQYYQAGKASWYGGNFHKRRTASGVIFDMNALTAAHRNLPFGAIVVVRDEKTNNKTLVCINDRGPFIKSKILDLSRKAAEVLGGNLQKITAQAFIPEKCNSSQSDTTLLLSFLSDYTPLLLDLSMCSVIDSLSDFTKACRLQQELAATSPDIQYVLSIATTPSFVASERSLAGKYVYIVSAILSNAVPHEEITSAEVLMQ